LPVPLVAGLLAEAYERHIADQPGFARRLMSV